MTASRLGSWWKGNCVKIALEFMFREKQYSLVNPNQGGRVALSLKVACWSKMHTRGYKAMLGVIESDTQWQQSRNAKSKVIQKTWYRHREVKRRGDNQVLTCVARDDKDQRQGTGNRQGHPDRIRSQPYLWLKMYIKNSWDEIRIKRICVFVVWKSNPVSAKPEECGTCKWDGI